MSLIPLNNWNCEESAIEHLEKVVSPYLSTKRQCLKLSDDQNTLLLSDFFKGQSTERVKGVMLENHCKIVFMPIKLTAHFQPLDLNVNGHAKHF